MRWLVIGAGGMLGRDVVERLQLVGADVRGVTQEEVDIREERAVLAAVRGQDVVVNCAAYTDVDGAEAAEAAAFAVNAVGPHLLARAAAVHGGRLVQVSTDYVFDGQAREPYAEDAAMNPAGAYGRTKAAGEWAAAAALPETIVVRTAWLYGAHGRCFPKTIATAAGQRDYLDVVNDQVGQPTWTVDLADLILRLVDAQVPGGAYHGTSEGSVSWHGFAQAAVAAAGFDPGMVRPMASSALERPAPRPAYSVLGHDGLRAVGVEPIGRWDERWPAAAAAVLGL